MLDSPRAAPDERARRERLTRAEGPISTLYPYNARSFRDDHRCVGWCDFHIEHCSRSAA